jgi:hypothetical protein
LFEIDLFLEESPSVISRILEENQSMADIVPINLEMDPQVEQPDPETTGSG